MKEKDAESGKSGLPELPQKQGRLSRHNGQSDNNYHIPNALIRSEQMRVTKQHFAVGLASDNFKPSQRVARASD